jgi:hypothetical protein
LAGSEGDDPYGLLLQDATRVPEENLGNVFRWVFVRAIGAKSDPAKRNTLRRVFFLVGFTGLISTRLVV